MLTSLLYRRTPEEPRMLMIDPKVVELAPYDRIPHILLPVVTDMNPSANANPATNHPARTTHP